MKSWIKGALVGAGVCVFLFVFYSVSLQIAHDVFHVDTVAQGVMLAAFATGHGFPILTGFMYPAGIGCKAVVPICTAWEAGAGCVEQTMSPETACVERTQSAAFVMMSLLLVLVYAAIGAGVGAWMNRRKTRRAE